MEINELLNRYFEGETSGEEERRLRAFFASDKVPPELAVYKQLFTFWEEETNRGTVSDGNTTDIFRRGIPSPGEVEERGEPAGTRLNPPCQEEKALRSFRKRAMYAVAGLAASVFLVLGIRQFVSPVDPCFCAADYVVIDGRCYTDVRKIRTFAWQALQEVGTPAEAYFPGEDEAEAGREIIGEQLDELRTLFNENE